MFELKINIFVKSYQTVLFGFLIFFLSQGAMAEPRRISVDVAERLIETWWFTEVPYVDRNQKFPVKEITLKDIWGKLHGQVFEITGRYCELYAFFIKNKKVTRIGFDPHDFCVTDLNDDGIFELVYALRVPWDGYYGSYLGIYSEGFLNSKVIFQGLGYFGGEYHLKKRNEQSVEVIVDSDNWPWSLKIDSTFSLGRVGLVKRNGKDELIINFFTNLPSVVKSRMHAGGEIF